MQVSSNVFSVQSPAINTLEENKSFQDHEVMRVFIMVNPIKEDASIKETFIDELSKHNITYEELEDASQWVGWNNEELIADFMGDITYPPKTQYIILQLEAIMKVCSLKRFLQNRYPNEKVEINKEFRPVRSTWNASRNWCTISGINAKEFDDLHGDGKPFTI